MFHFLYSFCMANTATFIIPQFNIEQLLFIYLQVKFTLGTLMRAYNFVIKVKQFFNRVI